MKSENKIFIKSFDFNKLFRKLLIIIPIGVIGNILFSLYTSDKAMLPSLINFSYGYFLLAIILTIIPWLTNALRILIWTQFLGKGVSFCNILKIVLGTDLGAAISPTAVGGAPVKIGMLVQEGGISTGIATSITFLANIEDNLFAFLAVPFALTVSSSWELPILKAIFYKMYIPFIWTISGLVFIIIASLLILKIKHRFKIKTKIKFLSKCSFYEKFNRKVKDFWSDFKSVYYLIAKKGKFRFLISMGLTSIQWICRFSVISALLISLNIAVEPIRFFALQWFVFTLMNFVPTPGAAAGAEATFYLIFKSFFPSEVIGLITTGWRFLTFYFLLILGAILIILLNMPKKFLFKKIKRLSIQYY